MKRYICILLCLAASLCAQDNLTPPTIPAVEQPDSTQSQASLPSPTPVPTPPVPSPQMGGIVQMGYVWSMDVIFDDPDPTIWGTSQQGFDAKVGTSQFVTLGIWTQVTEVIQTDLSFTLFWPFHYQKYQTDPTTGITSIRFFDFSHQNMMLTTRFIPSQSYSYGLQDFIFTPFAEGGVGASMFEVTNFHAVSFDPSTQTTTTTDIANRAYSPSYAGQLGGGIRITHAASSLTLDILGRYYKGGTLTTNPSVMDNTTDGGGAQVPVTPWQGQFQATEIVISLNINI